jgi:hypothetical protein
MEDRTSTDEVRTPSRYDPALVEQAIFEEILSLYPQRLTVGELSLRIVADPADRFEVDVAAQAIAALRSSGLVRYRNDEEVVEPTHAALCAAAIFDRR